MVHLVFSEGILHVFLPHADALAGLRVVHQALLVNQVLQQVLGGLKVIPVPVVGLTMRDFLAFHILLEERMQQTLFHCNPLIRVETEHLGKQFTEFGADVRKQHIPLLFGSLGQRFDVLDGIFVANVFHVLHGRGSQNRYDPLHLVQEIFSWEERSAAKQFGHDASNRPDIDSFGVFAGIQDDFWGSVPAGHNVLCLFLFLFHETSGQSQIADFEVAVLVKKQVRRLEVPMDNIC